MLPRALLVATLLLGGCAAQPAAVPEASVDRLPAPSIDPASEKRFDDLTLTVELDSPVIESGDQVEAWLMVENKSDRRVVDPGCWLDASRSAVVPPGDPDAELWQHVVVDCSGSDAIHPGDTERHHLTFIAATKYGDPLPPGDYVAAVEYEGLSRRLEVPVTVVDSPASPSRG